MTDGAYPDDVYPDSGSRLPALKREALDDAGRALYDRLLDPVDGSIAGLQGPGGIRLYSAKISEFTQSLLEYFRRDADMEGHIRELAILVTAHELGSRFEWATHEPLAVKEGLDREIIETVRHGRSTGGLGETEAVVIRLGRELFARRELAPETFAQALRVFGPRGLVDLVSLMAQYSATATLLTAFDVQLHPAR